MGDDVIYLRIFLCIFWDHWSVNTKKSLNNHRKLSQLFNMHIKIIGFFGFVPKLDNLVKKKCF
jgi:hypothetical protein